MIPVFILLKTQIYITVKEIYDNMLEDYMPLFTLSNISMSLFFYFKQSFQVFR